MDEHYPLEEIQESLSGRLPAEKSREIIRHLLRGCPECQSIVRRERLLWPAHQNGVVSFQLDIAYNASLSRAEEMAVRTAYLPLRERTRFKKALKILETGDSVLALIDRGNMVLEGLGVYEALLARSWAVRFDSPREMRHLARAAVEIAHRFQSQTHGIRKPFDFAARAWGELANAYRVSGRLQDSEIAFGQAFKLFQQGTRPGRLLIRLFDLEASLLGALREFDLGLERLTSLVEIYLGLRETHMAGRALVTKALYQYYKGNSSEALETLSTGLSLVDKNRDPSLMAVATLNLLILLEDCGKFREARIFLFKNRSQIISAGQIHLLKVRAVEGRINYGLGELESAELAFREVKQSFQEAGLAFTSAIAGLDLALTLMRQSRTEEAIQEGLEATKIFVDLSNHREILGSVILLQEAFQAKAASLSLIDSTNRYLRRRQIELNLR